MRVNEVRGQKLEKLNAHVNALELAHNRAKPDTPQQNNQTHVNQDTHKQVNENNECEVPTHLT